jgi:hypothetical protein
MVVNPNVVLPMSSSILSFVFFVFLIDQWRERRRAYQLIWAIGMLWYALSAGTEFIGGAFGWSDPLYRVWYLIGAIWVAAWLGLGTVYLLARTRFGYAFAFSLVLAGLFTYLSWVKYAYPDSGSSALIYSGIALLLGIVIVVMTYRGDERWASVAGAVVVVGSVITAAMIAVVQLPAPGYTLNPTTHIPTGELLPGYLRLLTPFFNVTGAFALSLGALFSAYVFMMKRRVLSYSLRPGASFIAFGQRRYGLPRVLAAAVLVYAFVFTPFGLLAILVNFLVSLPAVARAVWRREVPSRVPATILIAIGGLIPAITSGLNRFGSTSGFFIGEFLGVVFLFAGFLVSIEVFHQIRIPFTSIVLRTRRAEA